MSSSSIQALTDRRSAAAALSAAAFSSGVVRTAMAADRGPPGCSFGPGFDFEGEDLRGGLPMRHMWSFRIIISTVR
jgi:hypothetical protein